MSALIFAFVLTALGAQAEPTPVPVSPAPAATPQLKIILNERSSRLCTTIRDTAAPMAFVTHRDDEAFAAINRSMLKFMDRTQGVTPATGGDLKQLESSVDDLDVYAPSAEMSVIQMEHVLFQVSQNLSLEDHVMDASWKEYPRGRVPNLDALRQRLQNLLDLQRALANKYLQFTGIYLDNRGQARFSATASDAATFKMFLRASILGMSGALADVHADGNDPEVAAQASAHDVARHGTVAAVVKELRLQEYAFANEIKTAAQTCGI